MSTVPGAKDTAVKKINTDFTFQREEMKIEKAEDEDERGDTNEKNVTQ